MLAVVWATKHFRPYLFGKTFEIFTDHRPLVYLFTMPDPSSRLTKFRLALEEFDFVIQYTKGTDNVVADALSRMSSDDLKTLNHDVMLTTTRSMISKQNDVSSDKNIPNNPQPSPKTVFVELVVCPEIKNVGATNEKNQNSRYTKHNSSTENIARYFENKKRNRESGDTGNKEI